MRAAILNQGPGAWAFSELADRLERALWVDVVDEPVDLNYVLRWDGDGEPPASFIPLASIEIAADKRTQTELFADASDRNQQSRGLRPAVRVSNFVSHRRWMTERVRTWTMNEARRRASARPCTG